MHRRALRTLAAVLLVAAAAAMASLLATGGAGVALASPEPPAETESTAPPAPPAPPATTPTIADNEFLPENANLSDCLGFVQRPGCGSEARGGLQQTLIFLSIAAGLAIIFWRVSVGVRRNRRAADQVAAE